LSVGDAVSLDARYRRTPPAAGLILNVYARMLERTGNGNLRDSGLRGEAGLEFSASHDHLWLTKDEWPELLPPAPKKGERAPLPAAVADRILRFHLVDNTRGEPPMWNKEEVRLQQMTLTVDQVTSERIQLRLDGNALLATDAPLDKGGRGYEVRLLGYLEYNPRDRIIQRFDIVALGDHWGEGTYTRGARPGRTPLGIAFELVRGDLAADRVPPQGARQLHEYFGSNP
jgi:hypothetical protein